MAFTVHLNPHHIQHPDGSWEGGEPERDHPHHVEHDCSTGLTGYTRLEGQELANHLATIATLWGCP